MLRPSPFVVSSGDGHASPVRMFSTTTKRAYSFEVGWDALVAAAEDDGEVETRLINEHLLTRDSTYAEAVDELLQWRARIAAQTLNTTFTVTTRCPMRCPYCFEAHLPRNHAHMETIDAFHRTLKATLDRDGPFRSAYLLIMGGEPLLCPSETERLLTGFVDVCSAAGTPVTTVMTINGTLAPTDLLDRLGSAGLQGLQVTFDGNGSLHEQIRPRSYDAILGNLPYLTSRFSTAIKYNVSKASSAPGVLEEFLDDLARVQLDPATYLIEFEPLKRSPSNPKDKDLYYSLHDPQLARAIMRMTRTCQERSFPASLGPGLRSPCVGTTDNALMIEPDGAVRSCITAYREDSFGVGHIGDLESLVLSKEGTRRWIMEVAERHCSAKACPYLPICQTGCLLNRRTQCAASDETHCRFSFFDSFFPELTDMMLAQRSAKKGEPQLRPIPS